jgi:hypothetical protein
MTNCQPQPRSGTLSSTPKLERLVSQKNARVLAQKLPKRMEFSEDTEPKPSIKGTLSGSQDESSTTDTLAPGVQSVISEIPALQDQQQQDFIPACSPYTSPQLTPQPEDSNVADSRQASQMAPDSDRLDSFQSRLQQLQDTLDPPMLRWIREADPSQEIARHYAPLGQPDSSIEEVVPEDRSERKGNASHGPSPVTGPNFDEQAAFSERPVGKHEHPVITTTTTPAPSTSTTNISSVVVQCLRNLGQLVSEDLSSFESEVSPALWKDELGRLRVWAANIGAHQTGQSSLDHRLRDASHIKEQTLRVLQRLQRTTEDINDVLHHSPEDDDFSDLSGDEDDGEHQTEIQSIYRALRDTINNLFQMSMVIRQPAQHDRLLGTKRSDAVFNEHFDRLHVMAKYPQAGEDIQNRLGLAISQRRAVMRYRERHRTKLGQGLNQVIEDQADGQSAKLSDTVATEFVEASPAAKDDWELQTVASQTSYAQTILNGAGGSILPPPPKGSTDGAPFECPYCFVIITIANRREWARHVFNDLMPYLCIYPGCPTPHRLYESRREWFSHLQSQHSISDSPGIHVDCPLCLSSVPTGKQLERHVGRHLEELALFALPRSEEDGDEAAMSSDEDSDKSHCAVGERRCPECARVFLDLRAHFLTHNPVDQPEYKNSHGDYGLSSEPSSSQPFPSHREIRAAIPPSGVKNSEYIYQMFKARIGKSFHRYQQFLADFSDVSVYNDELKMFFPASRIKKYPSEDGSVTQKEAKPQPVLEPEPDPQSAKDNHGQINLEVHEPAIGDNNTAGSQWNSPLSNLWRRYISPDYVMNSTSQAPAPHGQYTGTADENEPDIIRLRHRGTTYPLHFPAYAISDGVLTVGALRLEAATKIGNPFPDRVRLLYKGSLLKDDNRTCKAQGLKQNSEVLCVVSDIGPSTLSDSSDYESGHASDPPRAQSKIKVNKKGNA